MQNEWVDIDAEISENNFFRLNYIEQENNCSLTFKWKLYEMSIGWIFNCNEFNNDFISLIFISLIGLNKTHVTN